jgi:signal transduction histidine kinase
MAADHPSGPAHGFSPKPRPAQAAKITELTEANRRLKRKLFDLYTLFEISRNLSGMLELDRLLDNLLLTAIGQMGIGSAGVIVDRRAEDAYLGIWRTKGINTPRGFAPRLEKSGRLLGRLRAVRMPMGFDELRQAGDLEPREQTVLEQFEAAMICPMLVKEQVRGVLSVSRRLSDAVFTENDKEFLSILISHFAVAMDNARLYESERGALLRLKEAQAQLVHSEKLAAMGRLSATIAHEVNNPLGIIKNYLHLAQNQSKGKRELNESLEVVAEEVDRIAEIVRRLLDFYRPAASGKQDLELWNVIDECLKLLRNQQDLQNVQVARPEEHCPAPIHGNAEELKQVFLNLFMNALDAMPEGGALKVRVICRRHSLLAQVADSGPGIAPGMAEHLFEPFTTTKAEGQGTGLGLYVCYGIVQRHGGRITARNRPGGGAVFTVRLPLRERD